MFGEEMRLVMLSVSGTIAWDRMIDGHSLITFAVYIRSKMCIQRDTPVSQVITLGLTSTHYYQLSAHHANLGKKLNSLEPTLALGYRLCKVLA